MAWPRTRSSAEVQGRCCQEFTLHESGLLPDSPLAASFSSRSVGSSGAMAQGDNVCGETGCEQDAPLPVAVQLLDKSVPVDD